MSLEYKLDRCCSLFCSFFIHPAAIGLQRVEAADAAAAEGMVLDQHPHAQVYSQLVGAGQIALAICWGQSSS